MLAKGINPQRSPLSGKIAQQFAHENSFEAVAKEWHSSKTTTWSQGDAKEILNCLEKDVFPYIGQCPIEQIEQLGLLTVLQKLRNETHSGTDKQNSSPLRRSSRICNSYRTSKI